MITSHDVNNRFSTTVRSEKMHSLQKLTWPKSKKLKDYHEIISGPKKGFPLQMDKNLAYLAGNHAWLETSLGVSAAGSWP